MKKVLELIGRLIGYTFGQALCRMREAMAGDRHRASKAAASLDEPVAGMTDEETMKTGALLQRIAKECSVVVVEHDMEFVRSLPLRLP